MTIEEINRLDQNEFVAKFGRLFENSPWIASRAWNARPFADLEHLYHTLCETANQADPEEKLALIRAHPDLVGRAARAGMLTPESAREQSSAGLDRLSPEEIETFDRYNREYTEKFGFPFIICARENTKASILDGFAARLSHSRTEEIETAMREIAKICYLRLREATA